MNVVINAKTKRRYEGVTDEKSDGATYTPPLLADFVASQIAGLADLTVPRISILDPAIGDGELLISLLSELSKTCTLPIDVYGFDTNQGALLLAKQRLDEAFPNVDLNLSQESFLDFVIAQADAGDMPSLFSPRRDTKQFDIIIANPPYVRTQIIGSNQAQILGQAFGLSGRVDLYHAFLIGMAQVLKPTGTAGIIVSNRFMTTKGGASLRAALRTRLSLRHIWDLGDTKIFDAAVLPAVILAKGLDGHDFGPPAFTSIYQSEEPASLTAADPIGALAKEGMIALTDGRHFHVQHGTLDASGGADDLWRIATDATDTWLAKVSSRTWKTFGDLGKIRVGVKTCADKVFIRSDWDTMPEADRPELLRPLTTHHIAARFRAAPPKKARAILYPHEVAGGRRQPIDLARVPKAKAYLESHSATLRGRSYVIEAGRRWYEIWVPQDPASWDGPKLVFRDISERPTFWIDLEGTIVNGDCYWLTAEKRGEEDLLWLAAAVANSSFIEAFYDHRFNNKLYAGRRRFITQYVEQFPLPDPTTALSQGIIAMSKAIYAMAGAPTALVEEKKLDAMIWRAFGLDVEEVCPEGDLKLGVQDLALELRKPAEKSLAGG